LFSTVCDPAAITYGELSLSLRICVLTKSPTISPYEFLVYLFTDNGWKNAPYVAVQGDACGLLSGNDHQVVHGVEHARNIRVVERERVGLDGIRGRDRERGCAKKDMDRRILTI